MYQHSCWKTHGAKRVNNLWLISYTSLHRCSFCSHSRSAREYSVSFRSSKCNYSYLSIFLFPRSSTLFFMRLWLLPISHSDHVVVGWLFFSFKPAFCVCNERALTVIEGLTRWEEEGKRAFQTFQQLQTSSRAERRRKRFHCEFFSSRLAATKVRWERKKDNLIIHFAVP